MHDGLHEFVLLTENQSQVAVGLGIVGLDSQGELVGGDGFLGPACLAERAAEVEVGLGEIGPQFECSSITGDGFVEISGLLQGYSQVNVGIGKIGPQHSGLPIEGDRFVALALLFPDEAQVEQRLGVVRSLSQGTLTTVRGLAKLAHRPPGQAKIVVVGRRVRIDRDGLRDQHRGGGVVARLIGQNAQQVQCISVPGIDWRICR